MKIKWLLLLITTVYHLVATLLEERRIKPPGQLVDIGRHKLHLLTKGTGKYTVIIEHSLGGIDGYFLIEELAKITRVCICDRAGYGWSEMSSKPRCSAEIVKELNTLLEKAEIEPPYILVGDSFGSYNVRLYASRYPEKVAGIILTEGLHEKAMLAMSWKLRVLQVFFWSGFIMSVLGSFLGLVRILGTIGCFEVLKKELRQFSPETLKRVKRSFYRPQHWLTMAREIWNLDASARQVREATKISNIPLIDIKSNTFLKRSPGTFLFPLQAADRLRDEIHAELLQLSSNSQQMQASKSDHFVWIDEPEVIIAAVREILTQLERLEQ
ncbi:alpha/beta hydrolase [Spirulina sp. 06S082]|uniref:alpha/beta hydrolase n=1 Tax=Spirulina sp. 06S082 TaxID=3110248 RepID=UPI002B1EF2F1|nr:alpha/beta hydrolase [Spirulina sp. 06S082]MEA5472410.1 alpha/beta hydrolase [Spirulina sp. 06S082]